MTHSGTRRDLQSLATALGYEFSDLGRLELALIHPSVGGLERRGRDRAPGLAPGLAYERLEFLGDRVLGLVIAEWLLETYPDDREGDLAKRHAALVRRETLCRVAEGLGLGEYLRLSPGEEQAGGRTNRTILSDACEAVIGAMFLDGGLPVVRGFIRTHWRDWIGRPGGPPKDGKTALQEWAQGRGKPLPIYRLTRQSGPAHEPEFEITVEVAGEPPSVGIGRNRRAAEMAAANSLLRRLGLISDDPSE